MQIDFGQLIIVYKQGCVPREKLKSLVKLTKQNHHSASSTKF